MKAGYAVMLAVASIAVGEARAQFLFDTQVRSVSAGSICTSTSETVTAADFGRFDGVARAGDSGCWGEASQISMLDPTWVHASGSTRGYRSSTQVPYPWATTSFATTFHVAGNPSDFRLVTHWNYATWSFVGPGVSLASTGIFADRVDTGKLVPGTYTLQANANLEHMAGMIVPTDFAITLELRCVADVDDGSGTGTPDGGVGPDDLFYYLAIFEAGVIEADMDDGSGTRTLDGGVTIDDLLYFLYRFGVGC